MSRLARWMWVVLGAAAVAGSPLRAQSYREPYRGEPGDAAIQARLDLGAERLEDVIAGGAGSAADWEALRPRYREEYLYMLGLWPLPARTPLSATVTGRLDGDGYVVEKLHYQSRPQLYVTANLYRPAALPDGARLPAVLYVCGHSSRGRDGNKAAFSSFGIWFARHGYVCLVVDTLQLGEIPGVHHGTYREGRWWWHSRGYTPAGVECWNGVRGIDYLVERADVDPDRIAVTGISGGGAATFWVAAFDERVTVAVPVSGMADLPSYVGNRVIDGHCDCMFLHNGFEWPWTRIAALVAPRPLCFVNSDKDPIFPMDANERIAAKLERFYAQFGAGERFESLVSVGGHDYRRDIRRATYRFINMHLKHDASPVEDSERDLVEGQGAAARHSIPTADLRVFPRDEDVPADQLNTTIDEHFVPRADVPVPERGSFSAWKERLERELRRVVFASFGGGPPAPVLADVEAGGVERLRCEDGVVLRLFGRLAPDRPQPQSCLLAVACGALLEGDPVPAWLRDLALGGEAVYVIETRGHGASRWTRKSPPNYVDRAHVLLGRTVDGDRVGDVVRAVRFLRSRHGSALRVALAGEREGAVLAAYAAILEPSVGEVRLHRPILGHMDPGSPQLLNVLRVCDIPDALGMLAPGALTITGVAGDALKKTRAVYEAAESAERLTVR